MSKPQSNSGSVVLFGASQDGANHGGHRAKYDHRSSEYLIFIGARNGSPNEPQDLVRVRGFETNLGPATSPAKAIVATHSAVLA